MTTETITSAQSVKYNVIRSNSDEELVRSDYGTKNQSEKEAPASPVMAPSSTRKKRVVSSDEEEEVDRNKTPIAEADFDEQSETSSSKKKMRVIYSDSEESQESNKDSGDRNKTSIAHIEEKKETGGTPEKRQNRTTSSKKKKHVIYSPDKEEESIGRTCTPGMSLKDRPTAKNVKRQLLLLQSTKGSSGGDHHHSSADDFEECHRQHVKDIDGVDLCNTLITDSDVEGDEINESDSGSDNSSSSPAKRRSTRNSTCGTASAEKIKQEQALETIRRRRQRALSGLSESSNLENNNSPALLFQQSKNTLDLVEQDQGRGDDEESESESDMGDFIDDDSQSAGNDQEVAAALRAFKKLTKEEAFPLYVESILSTNLDSDYLPSVQDDKDFEKARDVIEGLIESRKNLVGSIAWHHSGFKGMLENCTILERETLPDTIMDTTCEACKYKPRNLTECMVFYEEINGEKVTPPVMEFLVGCFCAERGSIYHDLHHHDFELKKSCADKIEKVKEAIGTQSDDEDIVQLLINDEDWLHILLKTFEALLNSADQWAEGGSKRKHMKAHCASFH